MKMCVEITRTALQYLKDPKILKKHFVGHGISSKYTTVLRAVGKEHGSAELEN